MIIINLVRVDLQSIAVAKSFQSALTNNAVKHVYMTISFNSLPPDDQPQFPDRYRAAIHINSVPVHDQEAQAALILEALPYAANSYWRALGPSTKDTLVSMGLLKRAELPQHFTHTENLKRLLRIVEWGPEQTHNYAVRAVMLATQRFGSNAASSVTQHVIDLLEVAWDSNSIGKANFLMSMRKLVLLFIEDRNLGLNTFEEMLQTVFEQRRFRTAVDNNLVTYLTTTDPYAQQLAGGFLYQFGAHNSPPFLGGERFEKASKEAQQRAETIVTRSLKYVLNFDRFSAEARRIRGEDSSLLAKFGEASFEEAWRMKASNINQTPGSGLLLASPRMDRLFFGGRQGAAWYKEAYGSYGGAVEQFSGVSIVAMRAGWIVFHGAPQYSLPVEKVSGGRMEPYCLFLANNHFTGGLELSALLPVRIVRRHIMSSLEEFRPACDDPGVLDACVPGFNLESLAQESKAAGLPPLMLANLSVAFGGAVAAYPKGSAPYYEWEPAKEDATDLWQDALGRVHHAWRAMEFDSCYEAMSAEQITEARIKLLAPLAEGCEIVATAAEGLLNMLDLFMFRYDAWKCGLTPGQTNSRLMLHESYRQHKILRARAAKESEYSCLCLVDRYAWSEKPQLLIDTHSMELQIIGARKKTLPSEQGRLKIAEQLWDRHVLPHISETLTGVWSETNKTLMFLPREHVL